jgi:hypothetical protein
MPWSWTTLRARTIWMNMSRASGSWSASLAFFLSSMKLSRSPPSDLSMTRTKTSPPPSPGLKKDSTRGTMLGWSSSDRKVASWVTASRASSGRWDTSISLITTRWFVTVSRHTETAPWEPSHRNDSRRYRFINVKW